MLESISLPLCGAVRTEYGGWSGLREELARLGCGGIEAIWAGRTCPQTSHQTCWGATT